MSRQGSIGILQASMMVVLLVGITTHVTIIPILLQVSGRDAWIAVLVTALVYLPWTMLIYAIMKWTHNQPLIQWLERATWKPFACLIAFLLSLYTFSMGLVSLKEMVTWTVGIYLPDTPQLVIVFMTVLVCCLAAILGIRSIAITSGILLPIVVILGYFVMTANFQHKNYQLLTPLLENGISPVLQGCIYAGGGFVETIFLLLTQHHLKKPFKKWQILFLAAFIVMLTIGPLTGAIAEFGPVEAAKQRYPAFVEWRLVKIGKYIEHLDFLSLYQWFSGVFIRLSLVLYVSGDLLSSFIPIKRNTILVILSFLMVGMTMWPLSDVLFYRFLMVVYFPYCFVFSLSTSILLFGIALLSRKRKEGYQHENGA
ncbi:GerAB/ArcD/ProY family transporter [Brevibacillus ginsengisoli]|uniref:GerAB/ArcD/ProY family transporter n=1 Tax=Brevibacillus ginsengisoli TaxID=363854 RepID=UPI003CEC81DB